MEAPNLLTTIMNASTSTVDRQRAEAELASQRTANPEKLLQLFVGNLKDGNVEAAQMSCIMLKKYFLDNTEGASPGVFDQMRVAVLESLDFKTQPMVLLKRKGDLISKIFMLQEKSEELLQILVQWAQSDDSVSQQLAMYIFEKQAECHLSMDQLKNYKESFYTIFEKALTGADMKVRVAALLATTSFLLSVQDDDDKAAVTSILQGFQALREPMLETAVEALKTDGELGRLALESLAELSKTHPDFWENVGPKLVTIVSSIIKNKDFEDGTRSQAAEIVLALAKEVPAGLRKMPEMQSEFVPALVQLVTECEEDMDTWAETAEDEDGTGNSAYSAGIGAIERLSVLLKEKFTLAAFAPMISQCLASEDWKIKQAGYLTHGVIAEACKDQMKANADEQMKLACAGLGDAHPRVGYAALFCLSQLLVQLKPMAQRKYHAELVPTLIQIGQNAAGPKMKTQAVACMVNFVKGLIEEDENEIEETKKSSDIMMLYADQLFAGLVQLLSTAVAANHEAMLEQVLDLLNSTAGLIEEEFGKYFISIMPLLRELLSKVEGATPEQMRLRAGTIESMGVLIAAISEGYTPGVVPETEEGKQILAMVQAITTDLFTLVQKPFADEDPQELAVKGALAKIAFYLKGEFQVIAPAFLEILLKDANIVVKVITGDGALPAAEEKGRAVFDLKLRGMEDAARFSLNTGELEQKLKAFEHIMNVASAMGRSFEPYISTVLPVLLSHMNDTSRTLRKSALKTFQHLLTAQGEPANVALFSQIYQHFAMYILKANKDSDVKELKLLFKELYKCMKVISENEQTANQLVFESEDKLNTFGGMMQRCLATVAEKRQEQRDVLAERHGKNQIDQEDEAEAQEQLYKIGKAAGYVGECCGVLATTYKKDAFTLLDTNVKAFYAAALADYKHIEERELIDTTFFFIQFVEHCGVSDQMMLYELGSQFAEIGAWAEADMPTVRQNAACGIAAVARVLAPGSFKTLVPSCLKALERMLSVEEAEDENELAAVENATTALGVLALKQTKDDAQLNRFLAALPLKGEGEAQEANDLFLAHYEEIKAKPEAQTALNNIKAAAATNPSIVTDEARGKLAAL